MQAFLKNHLENLSLAFVSAAITVIAIEVLFLFHTAWLPSAVLMNLSTRRMVMALGNDPGQIVDRLPGPPWMKFKPNVTVHQRIEPKEVSTFSGDWKTDALGFKNPPAADIKKSVLVVMGDSHVEGVGVAPDENMAAVLTKKFGIPSYNLGVEGYGAKQMESAFNVFGSGPATKYAVFSFNGSVLLRVAYRGDTGPAMGAIQQRLVQDEVHNRDTVVNNSVLIAAARAVWRILLYKEDEVRAINIPDGDIVDRERALAYIRDSLERYATHGDKVDAQDLEAATALIESTILDFAAAARGKNIQPVVLLTLSSRSLSEVVYPDGLPERFKGGNIDIERRAAEVVRAFCRKHAITVADGISPVRDYMRSWVAGTPDGKLDFRQAPYFKVNEHPTPIAHALYAEAIAHAIKDE
jgi:hypothetical protein